MTIFQTLYDIVNNASIAGLNDISPYIRDRNKDFPCVLIEVPTENWERHSSGAYRRVYECMYRVVARSVSQAETIAESVVTAIVSNCNSYIDNIDREYEEGYDDDSVGLFSVIINFTYYTGVS